jgi:single-strand DNA-binding protein
MASVNKVILVGNCGRDPEVRYMADGKAVANISIATSSRRKEKDGNVTEDTQWHRVTFYDKLAEIVGEYVKKGKLIYVEGRLKYGSYTDKTTGIEKPTCDIIATEMQMLGGKDEVSQPRQPEQLHAPAQRQAPAPSGSGFDGMDSDAPF